MTKPFQCALVGFSLFERSTLGSFFTLATRRVRGCEVTDDLVSCDVVVVNSDNSASLSQFIARAANKKVLLIGTADGGTGWPTQPRPIKLMAVLNQLNQLLGGELLVPKPEGLPVVATSLPAATPAPQPVAKSLGAAPSAPKVAVQPARARPRNESNFGPMSDFMGLDASSTQTVVPSRVSRLDDILVVDDSDVALKFMKKCLYKFGFRAELASSGEEALIRVAQNNFKFVFLDVMMAGLDGYQTCRAIKQQKYAQAGPPVVVMLTGRGGSIDKIRGSLAGCDAYLTKPLNEAELLAVLSKHDKQVQRGFQPTSSASTLSKLG